MVLVVVEVGLEVLGQVLFTAHLNLTVLLGTLAVVRWPKLALLVQIHFDVAEVVVLHECPDSREYFVIVEFVDALYFAFTIVNAVV